ncbi:Ig-like domain-containing protein [Fulvivirgaceae bacterium BMA12]|uniref:Ig-like domain-containing protein n=1 Tax=Agaribacillus aureus TaxID=3051825 RepID=A0ABT8L151_9BACT|nr:Ig-like domain-containing protein [Fulvivirgaceae bacterium BMA12]
MKYYYLKLLFITALSSLHFVSAAAIDDEINYFKNNKDKKTTGKDGIAKNFENVAFFTEPTGADESVDTDEDVAYTFSVGDFTFSDIDGDLFNGIQIITEPAVGLLEENGTTVDIGVDDIIENVNLLVFTPTGDENGANYANFTFRVRDDAGETSLAVYTMTINVTAVNDVPSFTVGADETVDEDAGAQSVANWISVFDDGDPEIAQNLTFEITNNTNAGLFATAPAVSSTGTLTYETATNANGSATITIRVVDDGSGVAPNENTSATQTFDINVTAVDDAPSFTVGADETVDEDAGAQSVANWITVFDDGDPELVQNLTFDITNNTNAGLFTTAPAVSSTGTLTYEAAPNANGSATITIRLIDDGSGVAPNENTSATQTFDINVTAVNDVPSFTVGADETVDEDAGPQSVANWITVFDDGDPEIAQNLTYEITNNTNAGLFAAGPAVSSTGTLTYETAANANGSATITIRVVDDGSGVAPNENTSATQTFDITVNAVDDAPNFTVGADQTVDEDAGAQSVANWITVFDDGDPELVQNLTFDITNNTNAGLFTTAPAVSNTGTLTYEAAANANGSATITIRLIDDGSGVAPNENTSATQTFDINVTAVNDAPSFTVGADETINEDAGAQSVPNWITVFDDGDPELTQNLTFEITNNTNAGLFATGPAVSSTGTLTYETAADANGSATISLRVVDDGSGVAPNVNSSAAQTFDINVTAENDPPEVTNSPGNTNYVEGGLPVVVVDGAVSVSDVDNANLSSATVSFTGTYIQGEDELVFVQAGTGINGSFNALTGVLSLTGNEPVGDYQTVLSSLQYLNNAGANPTGGARELTFFISDGALNDTDTKTVFVVTNNSSPVLSNGGIDDVTADEDDPDFTIELFEEFEDAEDPDTDLVFAVENNTNPGLFNSTNIASATGILTLDFADNAFGTAQITVSATDTDGADVNSTFTVTVNGVNDRPTTTGIGDVNVNEDAANTVINLFAAFDDLEDADADLTYTVVQNTLPGLFSSVDIDNVAGTLTLDFNANSNGISNLTIRATDTGGLMREAPFTVTVTAVNDEPLLDDIPDPAPIDEDDPEQVINLSGINAGPNESQVLTVTASTTSTGLLTIAPVEYISPQSTGTIRYTPVPNASGTADIEVCVTDSGDDTAPNDNQVCKTFTVVVTSINDDPTIDPIPDPGTVFVNPGEQCVPLSGISAGPGENQTINVFATSSNTSLITNPVPVNYNSPDATGEVCYTPLANQFGQSTIAVTVTDGVGGIRVETFQVNVSPVNQEPTIDPVADFSIDEDATPGPLTLTGISPGPGESQDLDIELISDNTDLFDPLGASLSINYTQGNSEAILTYVPIENAFGEANITVRLTDNGPGDAPNDNQNEITFKITVNAVNDDPTLDEIPDQGVFDVGEEPPAVNLTGITEGPNEDQTISINFSSDNNALVDESKILVDYDQGNNFGSMTYVIEPGQEGEANITVCVVDAANPGVPGALSFCRTFKVTVSSAPDLEITNVILSLNEVSRGQSFEVTTSVRNNGNENVESTFLNYYLSSNDIFDDGVDDLLRVLPDPIAISADGVENNFKIELVIKESVPAGTYYIIVVVDKTNNIPELDEGNNIFSLPILVNSNKFPNISYTNAPNLLLSNDAFINYRAEADDDELDAPDPVSFYYRGISSDKEFTRKTADEIEENLFQFTLNREDFTDEIGIEYYFDVRDIGNLVTQTELSNTYIEHEDPGLTLDNLKYGSNQGSYQMVSVPLELSETSPDAVFEDDFGPYNKEKWRLFRFQGGTNVENKSGLEDILPGDAYWLIASQKPAEAVDTGKGTTTKVTKADPFVISLRQGWNQIGSPYNFNVSWSDVIAFNNDPVGVKTVLRHYDGSQYVESDMLSAFGGAFVESDTDIDIMIPVIKNGKAQSGRFAGGSGSIANQEGEWEVKIDLQTSTGGGSRINGIGMRKDASDSNDRYDASSSPSFDFLNNIELKFDHPEYFQKSFSKDIRLIKASEIWEFTITSNESSGFAALEWGDISSQFDDKELYLYDVANGAVINMLTTASYDVNMASSGIFKVYYGTKEFIEENLRPDNIHLGQSYPNPFTNTTHIPFTLAKSQLPYQLELSIFNLMGQKVKALAEGSFQSGFYELEWNGQNEEGDVQPSGVYIYKLIVRSPNGNDQSYYRRAILR